MPDQTDETKKAEMADTDPVVDEVRYWLDRDEFGLLSAVARLAGVTPTSVSGWATGSSRPSERHWHALEEAFGQRAGHLKRIAAGEIAPRSTPIDVTVPRPGGSTPVGRPAGSPRTTSADVLERLAELERALSEVRNAVAVQDAALDKVATTVEKHGQALRMKPKAQPSTAPSKPAPPPSGHTRSGDRQGSRSDGAHTPHQGVRRRG